MHRAAFTLVELLVVLTIIVLLLAFLGGMIMLSLGVLGVYIFRIFQEVLARPRYVIDETVNLEGASDGRS